MWTNDRKSSSVQGCDDFDQDKPKTFRNLIEHIDYSYANFWRTTTTIFPVSLNCRSRNVDLWRRIFVISTLSVMQISVVLKTKVEFSNRAGDNEPQRRCRAFHAASSISKIPFLPTASVYFLLWLLSLMFSTRHATTDVVHSFTLMRWGVLFGMTSTFQPCHKWYITAMTNCSVTCLPSFVLFMLTEASFGEKARRKLLRRMRDITQSVNGGSTAAAASFSWQACLSLSEVIVLQSVN